MTTTLPYVFWRGVRMDANSIPSLLMAEKKSGIRIRVTQGGYNRGGVAASAGTHDGGAVIDISVSGLSSAQRTSLVKWLRLCGWAAWLRTPAQGFVYHIHAVRIGDNSASRGAKAQVISYKLGRNGLRGNGRDDGPKVGYVTWSDSKYNPKNAPKKAEAYVIAGKPYKPLSGVSVYWVNQNRKAFLKDGTAPVSRHVHRLQVWLTAAGFPCAKDGRWSADTQTALDDFRRKKLKWPVTDSIGPLGISSLKKAKQYGASTDKYDIREGK